MPIRIADITITIRSIVSHQGMRVRDPVTAANPRRQLRKRYELVHTTAKLVASARFKERGSRSPSRSRSGLRCLNYPCPLLWVRSGHSARSRRASALLLKADVAAV
jgi:hypothetical protein